MRQFRSYIFNEKQVTALIADAGGTKYIFMAFAKDNLGNCKLKRVSASDLNQLYSEIDIEAENINKLWLEGSYVYVALDAPSILGCRYYKYNLLGSTVTFTKPVSIIEEAIDITISNNYVYFLIPGIVSGEVTKIVKMTLTGSLEEIIVLEESGNTSIRNAVGMTIDNSGNIWIVTGTDPAQLVRVYEDSGGIYTYTIHEIT